MLMKKNPRFLTSNIESTKNVHLERYADDGT